MIDSYVHCGQSKYQPAEAVLATMRGAGVDRAVLIQHLGEYDNGYLEQVVAMNPGTFVAVGLVAPDAADWEERLDAVADAPAFIGLRLTTQMLVSYPRLGAAAASSGLALFIYTPDGVLPAREPIRRLAVSVSDLPIVITHLGCPRVEGGQVIEGWDLMELGELPNVMVTLSGQAMFCPYPHRPMEGFIREVVDVFTAERILWGSNYPVNASAADYARDLSLVTSGHWGLTPRQVERITEANAAAMFFAAAF